MTLAEVMIAIFDLNICYVILLHQSLQPEMLNPGTSVISFAFYLVTCRCNFRETADDTLKSAEERR